MKWVSAAYLQRIQNSYFDLFKAHNNLRIVVIDVSKLDFVKDRVDYNKLLSVLSLPHEAGMKIISL